MSDIDGLMPQLDAVLPNTHLVFAPGRALHLASGGYIVLGTAITKRIDQVWAPGDGGCLDVLAARQPSEPLFTFVIENPTTGAVDIIASAAPAAPLLPAAAAGYTHSRRITSAMLDPAGNLYQCIWKNDGTVLLKTPVRWANAKALGDPVLYKVFGPHGIKFKPIYQVYLHDTGPGSPAFYFVFRDPELGSPGPASVNPAAFVGASRSFKTGGAIHPVHVDDVMTDANGKVYLGASSATAQMYTADSQGWFDPRDEYA